MGTNSQYNLRELQLAESEILDDFVTLCKENNLQYFLVSGTLLGAVRHKGFIPWDDDIDVAMPYGDYLKFLKIASGLLGDKYFVQCTETDPDFYPSFAKIKKNNTTFLDKEHLSWNIHRGIWIDIFPIVYTRGGLEYKIKKTIIKNGGYLSFDSFLAIRLEEYSQTVSKLKMTVLKAIHKIPKPSREKLRKKLESYVFNHKVKKYAVFVSGQGVTPLYPAEIFKSSCNLDFEGQKRKAPVGYKNYLEITYGDYMTPPPEDKRVGHGQEILVDLNRHYTYYTDKTQ